MLLEEPRRPRRFAGSQSWELSVHCLRAVFSLAFGLLLIGSVACTFAAGEDELQAFLYLDWDESEQIQLWRHDEARGSQQLTTFEGGVLDYGVSPDGRLVAVAANRTDGGTDLWVMAPNGSARRALHRCPKLVCWQFAWAPDSRRLLFEEREMRQDGSRSGPSLKWLDTQSGETASLIEPGKELTANGRISADGQWLAYHAPQQEGLVVASLTDDRSTFLANEIASAPVWHPQESRLLLPQVDLVILHGDEGDDHQSHEHAYRTAVHIVEFDPGSGEKLSLSGDLPVEDSAPAWSPDGRWIAFGRRPPGTGAPRQLWLMRADGSQMRALADDPQANHGPASWSADGRYLLFQQIAQDDPTAAPAIWRLDIDSGSKQQLVAPGMQPSWLPEGK